MSHLRRMALLGAVAVLSGISARYLPAQVVACVPVDRPLARGFCDVSATPDPSGVVRAKASVDKATRRVTVTVEFETDNLKTGPCGRASAILLGGGNIQLAKVEMKDAACTGGKKAGKAKTWGPFSYSEVVPDSVVARLVAVEAIATKTGAKKQFMSIQLSDAIKAIGVVIQLLAGGGKEPPQP